MLDHKGNGSFASVHLIEVVNVGTAEDKLRAHVKVISKQIVEKRGEAKRVFLVKLLVRADYTQVRHDIVKGQLGCILDERGVIRVAHSMQEVCISRIDSFHQNYVLLLHDVEDRGLMCSLDLAKVSMSTSLNQELGTSVVLHLQGQLKRSHILRIENLEVCGSIYQQLQTFVMLSEYCN